jgi:D-beta-D-heptose 7-phosphate kinase/D-beta-D-heptose 1-phosphate adenosyltransferase
MASSALPLPRLQQLLQQMRGKRILVVGDVMLDRYLAGDTERISPEAPVPVVTVTSKKMALGGAANVAANVVALGAEAMLVGVVGDDRDGAALKQAMQAQGIADTYLLTLSSRPTTCKTRVLARGQQVVRIDEEDDAPLAARDLAGLTQLALGAVKVADALLLEDYDKGVLGTSLINEVMAAAKAKGIPVVVDPKHRSFFAFKGATLFKPNRRELANAVPGINFSSLQDLSTATDRLEVDHLLLTLGEGGMVLIPRNNPAKAHLIQSLAQEVFDVSGAGDTVTAWAGSALAAGATPVEAAELANLAAGIEVTKAGVATVSPEEILAVAEG